jgi:hypothetical protein
MNWTCHINEENKKCVEMYVGNRQNAVFLM